VAQTANELNEQEMLAFLDGCDDVEVLANPPDAREIYISTQQSASAHQQSTHPLPVLVCLPPQAELDVCIAESANPKPAVYTKFEPQLCSNEVASMLSEALSPTTVLPDSDTRHTTTPRTMLWWWVDCRVGWMAGVFSVPRSSSRRCRRSVVLERRTSFEKIARLRLLPM